MINNLVEEFNKMPTIRKITIVVIILCLLLFCKTQKKINKMKKNIEENKNNQKEKNEKLAEINKENEINQKAFDKLYSGKWTGRWFQGNANGEMTLDLTVVNNKISGNGTDVTGNFTIRGTVDEDDIQFDKQYIGKHLVSYKGSSTNGKKYKGTWDIKNNTSGKFEFNRP